ncbi:succinyldiaminopimelate transaminase [Schaalia canis]|uniref:Aminotransferase n=1 Tax=Schaalia canis TaxID=100469 RepID=A0A3P1SET9_9ACTO|nr:succinyldiaminopimelate transaminase [Schaalia canis]RRC95497.1 succinyldiaminopimelate transaminase [Schaalia canis]
MLPTTLGLPDFPWDKLAPAKAQASAHPDGICDLSVGTPVDPTPALIQEALKDASDAPGYPTVVGTQEVRDAIRAWGARRNMVDVGDKGVIPTIGSKEAVAWLPLLLGVQPGQSVLVPHVAYPTYDVGARLAGATPIPVDPTRPGTWPDASLVYLNSPGNPDGHVLTIDELVAAVEWARAHKAVIVSDECYAALPWEEPYVTGGVPSVLDRRVCGEDPSGIIVLYSLSKQSNLAGYRAALMYGDPALISAVVEVRKHAGMMVPAPVQHAMAVALRDEAQVAEQYRLYARRREVLKEAVLSAGLLIDEVSAAGLYLWVRRPSVDGAVFSASGRFEPTTRENEEEVEGDSWALVDLFAKAGILVAPGAFYGDAARDHVRIALTATDERIDAASARIMELGADYFRA